MRRSLILLLAMLFSHAALARPEPADLVLHHGTVLTVDPQDSVAQAIAVRAGRIVAVGEDGAIDAYIGPATRVIDLSGRTVTPGLIDTHAHIIGSGLDEAFKINLLQAASVAEILDKVKSRIPTAAPGEWIQGFGWNEGIIAEHRAPTLAELDAVSGDHPVVLLNVTHHYVMVNSAGLNAAGISAATPDPAGGTIMRDPSGAPTGILKENAQYLVLEKLPKPTIDQYRQVLRSLTAQMNAEGMTGAKEPALQLNDWAPLVQAVRADGLRIHLCTLILAGETMDSATAALAMIRQARRDVAALPGGDLGSCGAKILLDGSAMGRTAWRHEDYPADPRRPGSTGHGYPSVEPATYRQMVAMFNQAGVTVGTHAIGDHAIDLAVDAYAAALAESPHSGLRHSIIHAHEPTEHALAAMADLQRRYDAGIPETQAEFLWALGDALPAAFGPERSQHLMPLATYVRRGILFTGGSDYGVTPLPARFGLWASVAREPLRGVFGPHPFGTAEAVDIRTALRSYTIWAARQLFADRETGSLEVGKWADIAVWDRNPYAVPTAALKDMRCEMTVYKGQVVFER